MQVKRKYRAATGPSASEGRKSNGLLSEGRPRDTSKLEKDGPKMLLKSEIDAELASMRNMTAKEAAAAAARAVAEAEAAMAEAEEAMREAEEAEAEAEAAQAFAEAAMRTLNNRTAAKQVGVLASNSFLKPLNKLLSVLIITKSLKNIR